MINKYYNKIVDIHSKLNSIEYNTEKNRGTLFEYISACYNNAYLYDDPELKKFKLKYEIPNKDCSPNSIGIDLVNLEENILIQCKYYISSTLRISNISSFSFTVQKPKFNEFKKILSVSQETKVQHEIEDENNSFQFQRIPTDYINQIINESYKIKENISDNTTNTEIILRDYQEEIIKLINSNNKYNFKLPCGTGKTFVMAYYIKNNPNLKIAVLTPSLFLANKFCDLLDNYNIKTNRIFSDHATEEIYNISICVYNSWEN